MASPTTYKVHWRKRGSNRRHMLAQFRFENDAMAYAFQQAKQQRDGSVTITYGKVIHTYKARQS